MASYMVNKAKKAMRKFNDSIYNEKSEVYQATVMVNATQADHIFTQSDYPTIADYVENLIILTPNRHYSMAHPNNKTKYVYKDFQYICLIAKSTKIYLDLTSEKEDKFYDFEDYKLINDNKLDRNPIYLNDISRVRMVAEEQNEYEL